MLVDFIENFNNPVFLTDFIICMALAFTFSVLLIVFFRKVPAVFMIAGLLLGGTIFLTLGFYTTGFLLFCCFVITAVLFSFANISELRHFFIKPQHKKKKAPAKYNKEELYRVIDETVHSLSRSKTGAIMTFERSTNLDDVMKNGTIINAPVSQELLETIFYEGTRLHDGAVVIRDNIIVAASVYYTPTTRALTGKYGSRHRAAFGISEISDSITVVVSEETGRVSIAYNGTLEAVSLDAFLREFSDLMSIGI